MVWWRGLVGCGGSGFCLWGGVCFHVLSREMLNLALFSQSPIPYPQAQKSLEVMELKEHIVIQLSGCSGWLVFPSGYFEDRQLAETKEKSK